MANLKEGLFEWETGQIVQDLLQLLKKGYDSRECIFKEQLGSLSILLEEIKSVVQQHLLVSNSIQTWLNDVQTCLTQSLDLLTYSQSFCLLLIWQNTSRKLEHLIHVWFLSISTQTWLKTFLDESLILLESSQRNGMQKLSIKLKDLIDVGKGLHTRSLFAVANPLQHALRRDVINQLEELSTASNITELETNDESVDSDTNADEPEHCTWFSKIIDLTKKIKKLGENDNECLALVLLAGYAEQYVHCWNNIATKLLKSERRAAAVESRLCAVLEMAYELCLAPDVKFAKFLRPSAGELTEIVDDFRRYTQMMNHLLGRLLPSENTTEVNLIFHLQRKVEFDCKLLNSTIKRTFKDRVSLAMDDVNDLIDWRDLHIHDEFSDDSIHNAHYQKKIPVLLKNVRKDSFEAQVNMAMQLQQLDSSHITRLIGHSEKEDQKILILEHMEGDFLTLKRHQLSLPAIIDIMIQTSKAMMHLHQNHTNQHDGWLYPTAVFFKVRNKEHYLVKIANFARDNVSGEQDDVSRFDMMFQDLYSNLPENLMKLLNSYKASDGNERPDFNEIREKLWIVMEEVLTGSDNTKQGLELKESNSSVCENLISSDTLSKRVEPTKGLAVKKSLSSNVAAPAGPKHFYSHWSDSVDVKFQNQDILACLISKLLKIYAVHRDKKKSKSTTLRPPKWTDFNTAKGYTKGSKIYGQDIHPISAFIAAHAIIQNTVDWRGIESNFITRHSMGAATALALAIKSHPSSNFLSRAAWSAIRARFISIFKSDEPKRLSEKEFYALSSWYPN